MEEGARKNEHKILDTSELAWPVVQPEEASDLILPHVPRGENLAPEQQAAADLPCVKGREIDY
jgi:hypothetical protein